MTDQIALDSRDDRLYERGFSVAHSSADDGFPDVGKSIGLGDGRMVYCGERPGQDGWSLCIYSRTDPTINIASGVDHDAAFEMIDLLGGALNQ